MHIAAEMVIWGARIAPWTLNGLKLKEGVYHLLCSEINRLNTERKAEDD